MRELAGKVAVVTGAASGIGLATSRRLAAAGMKVVLADIEQPALDEAEASLTAAGAQVAAVLTDVSDASSMERLRDRAVEQFGTVHLVHNNAGVGVGGPLWTVSEADWRWVLGVNLWGVVHGVRVFVPLLVDQGEGHVVNTASVAGLTSPPFLGPYNTTKHAVVALSESLYRDLKVAGSPVGVSVLCPGFVRTGIADSDRNRPEWAPGSEASGGDPVALQMVRQLVAAGSPPEEIAEHVVDAIIADRFYIVTHPEALASVQTRMCDLLEGRPPTGFPHL
jgi:NAD(P)-dependent dehydrogenase (short-subunit alcohol dehydrogenase family)